MKLSSLVPLAFALAGSQTCKGEKVSSVPEIAQEARARPAESFSIEDLSVPYTLDKVRTSLLEEEADKDSKRSSDCGKREIEILKHAWQVRKRILEAVKIVQRAWRARDLESAGFPTSVDLSNRDLNALCPEGEFTYTGQSVQAFVVSGEGPVDILGFTRLFFASHLTECQQAGVLYGLQECVARRDCAVYVYRGDQFPPHQFPHSIFVEIVTDFFVAICEGVQSTTIQKDFFTP